jgi:UDP-glucose 4-epimerase
VGTEGKLMRCFITGATGFLGSHLVRRLVEKGNTVKILLRAKSDSWRIKELLPRVEVVRGDIISISQVTNDICSFQPDLIFHLAWGGANSSTYQNDPSQVFTNLYGSLELVQLSKKVGARFIGMGSAAEYGNHSVPITENAFPKPETLYGMSKYCTYLLANKFARLNDVNFVWLRPFYTYGPYDDKMRMIPAVTLSLLEGRKPALTAGDQLWDYLYVEDAIEAIFSLALNDKAQGVFNIGSGETHPIKNIVLKISELVDPGIPLGFGEVPYKPLQRMLHQADITLLKNISGWSPKVSLEDGLTRTVSWFRENQQQYK